MDKRRSSTGGRRLEILLGAPPPVDIAPRGPDLKPAAAPQPQAPIDQRQHVEGRPGWPPSRAKAAAEGPILDQVLRAEARAGQPVPAKGPRASSTLAVAPLLTPEMELTFIRETRGAGKPSVTGSEMSASSLERTMESKPPNQARVIYGPPPSETGDAPANLLPPRSGRVVYGREEKEVLRRVADVQASDNGTVEPFELPSRDLTEEEKQQLLERLGDARIQEIDQEITRTYDQVLNTIGVNQNIANECYNQLLRARDIVLRREAAQIPQAEYYVEQVQARLKRAAESLAGAKKCAFWITGWGFLWGAAFLTALVSLNQSLFPALAIPPRLSNLPVDLEIMLSAMAWGGIGGVVAVWYSLFKHVGQRDFDTQYVLSYAGKPFLGLVLGATVYMFFFLMLEVGLLPIALQEGYGTVSEAVTPWIVYPVAWISGFKENYIFDLVNRMMKRIFLGKEAAESALSAETRETAA